MLLKKGAPKSRYCPGSSTDVVLFEPNRIGFCEDLRQNVLRVDVRSRFSLGLGRPLVETDVKARSPIAYPLTDPLSEGNRT
jgi:phosphatidylserine decarboxylase